MRKTLLNIALLIALAFSYVASTSVSHATVTTSTNTITYVGDNATVAFSFPNLFFDEDHLVVTVDDVVQVITTIYTVAGEGVQAGGTVTFLVAPATNADIVIQRIVPAVQLTDFSNFDGNPADVTEKQFDLVVMMNSQIIESSDRNITVPVGTTLTSNDISGTIDTTARLLTITTAGPATALVGSLADNLNVTLTSQATGDLLRASSATDWANVTQASLGLLTDVVSDLTPQAGGDFDMNSQQMQWSKGADVASASDLPILTDGNYFDVTGTTQINTIATTGNVGTWIRIQFDGVLVLAHNATNLVLPAAGANITTAAGDEATCVEYASADFRCTYTRANGTALVGGAGAYTLLSTATASNSTSIDFTSNIDATFEEYEIHIISMIAATDNTSFFMRTDSDGGASFDAGASDYSWTRIRMQSNVTTHGATSDSNSTEISLDTSVGNAASNSYNAVIRIFDTEGSTNKVIEWTSGSESFDDHSRKQIGVATRQSTANIDAFRFLMSSGNIASGEFKLYGIEK